MADKLKKPIFTKEKAEILKKNLGQYDTEIKVNPLSSEDIEDITSIKDRTFLLHILIETLCIILEKDKDKRKKLFRCIYKTFEANTLVDSDSGIDVDHLAEIRSRYALRFYEHIKQVHQSLGPLSDNLNYEEQDIDIPISRVEKYAEAFDEIQLIAKGGFGTVCKARHKVDGLIYAVKKITFRYRKDSDYVKVMKEVRNLSSLSNKFVVAYNNAWVQPADEPFDPNSEELDSENDYTDDESTSNCSINQSVQSSWNDACRVSSCHESSSIIFQKETQSSMNTSRSESSYIVFQSDSQPDLNNSQSKTFSSNSSKNESPSDLPSQSKTFSSNSSKNESPSDLPNFPILKIKMMLCIQMEFCDYDLRHWINARNEGNDLPFSKSIPDIFREILCGVAYIHERGIIHRDLKPQNIFFSKSKGVMKVGDFGLATISKTPLDKEQGVSNHSTNLGTIPYAAPEQRQERQGYAYDSKVDMYSLGVILFELLLKTVTRSEFFKAIENFKKGIASEEIEQRCSEYVPLLKNLLQQDHDSRMKAKQVLDMPLFKGKVIEASILEQKVKDLESKLVQKEQEIMEREKVLKEQFQELEKGLKEQFQELEKGLKEQFQEREKVLKEQFQEREKVLKEQFQEREKELMQKIQEHERC